MGDDEPVGLCLVDASGAIIDCDEAFAELLTLSGSQVLGFSLAYLLTLVE